MASVSELDVAVEPAGQLAFESRAPAEKFDIRTAKKPAQGSRNKQEDGFTTVLASPGGLLAAGTVGGAVYLGRLGGGEATYGEVLREHKGEVQCLALHHAQPLLARCATSVSADAERRVHTAGARTERWSCGTCRPPRARYRHLATFRFVQDRCRGPTTHLCGRGGGGAQTLPHGASVLAVAWIRDALLSGGTDGTLVLWQRYAESHRALPDASVPCAQARRSRHAPAALVRRGAAPIGVQRRLGHRACGAPCRAGDSSRWCARRAAAAVPAHCRSRQCAAQAMRAGVSTPSVSRARTWRSGPTRPRVAHQRRRATRSCRRLRSVLRGRLRPATSWPFRTSCRSTTRTL